MKKLIILILISVFFSIGYCQLSVSPSEARKVAEHVLQEQNTNRSFFDTDIDTIFTYNTSIRGINSNLLYEVVFITGESILLSGHKNCQPILAINSSSKRETILNNMDFIPLGLKDIINEYIEQIAFAFEKGDAVNSMEMQEEWQNLLDDDQDGIFLFTEIISPLLTTQWGQSISNDRCDDYAYNYYVTESNNTCVKCAAGCVATAMAQIMRYWNYPVFRYGKEVQYDWCNMPDSLNYYLPSSVPNPAYEIQRNAIARLMADCGEAADMRYCYMNDCQSFTWPINARNALVDSFQYSSNAKPKGITSPRPLMLMKEIS